MHIESLHLEVTRNCTLECEHCFRGDRQNINMNPIVLDRIFNSVKKVDFLLLTGGEPFLAIEVIEKLVEILKMKKARIYKTYIITNGTVLNQRIVNAIEELSRYTYIRIDVSVNIFHKLELDRLGLTNLKDKNLLTLKRIKLPVPAGEYGKENDGRWRSRLDNQGRAKNLTSERLAQINALSTQEYYVSEEADEYPETTIEDNKVEGNITIDAYGNVVSYGQSFEAEDLESQETMLNIMTIPFDEAVHTFVEEYLPKKLHTLIKK